MFPENIFVWRLIGRTQPNHPAHSRPMGPDHHRCHTDSHRRRYRTQLDSHPNYACLLEFRLEIIHKLAEILFVEWIAWLSIDKYGKIDH